MAKHKPKDVRTGRAVVRLSRSPKMPKARQFLQHYFAMERPNTTHLFFSKGIIDFLLGLVIGVLVGIIVAILAGITG
ncbi:hypothetical protein HYU17_05945 [Candidatus Woesearchaeota archaeon]|nr:hypothetical protein [Candidatus Woesearchaeota archaeon]